MITVRANKKNKGPWKNLEDQMKNAKTPSWVSVDPKEYSVKITGRPTEEEVKNQPFDTKLIVEFYSR